MILQVIVRFKILITRLLQCVCPLGYFCAPLGFFHTGCGLVEGSYGKDFLVAVIQIILR